MSARFRSGARGPAADACARRFHVLTWNSLFFIAELMTINSECSVVIELAEAPEQALGTGPILDRINRRRIGVLQ